MPEGCRRAPGEPPQTRRTVTTPTHGHKQSRVRNKGELTAITPPVFSGPTGPRRRSIWNEISSVRPSHVINRVELKVDMGERMEDLMLFRSDAVPSSQKIYPFYSSR